MSTHPLFIDNIAFAKKNERLTGSLSLADCPRLSQLLQATKKIPALKSSAPESEMPTSKTDAAINYVLQGETNAAGQHLLHMTLTTNLTTTCQRCLEEMPLRQVLRFNYLISEASINEMELGDLEDDEMDLQEASQAMNIIALIEDEIIMAMPIAPVHDKDCGATVSQSGEKPNPFAVLKGLLGKSN